MTRFLFPAGIVFTASRLIFALSERLPAMLQLQLLQSQVVNAATQSSSADYFPIALQILFAFLFVGFMMLLTHNLGPKRATEDKLQNFESGIGSKGNARQPMAIKYFLVAILFVLFDVEVIFFYPYAVNFRSLGWNGFLAVILFVGLFLAGFIYIIKKKALQWDD